MENTLRRLFNYQKSAKNKDLQQIIDSVHDRYSREVGLDVMGQVNAAVQSEIVSLRGRPFRAVPDTQA